MAVVKCPLCGKYTDSSFGNCLGCGADVLPSGVAPSNKSSSSTSPKRHEGTPDTASQIIGGLIIMAILGGGYYLLIGKGPSPAEVERDAKEAAEKRAKGFHCLSSWDGSHSEVVKLVVSNLRDPDSFDHTETKITPVDEIGEHRLFMEYRAANGFGGLTVGTATATISNSDCSAKNYNS